MGTGALSPGPWLGYPHATRQDEVTLLNHPAAPLPDHLVLVGTVCHTRARTPTGVFRMKRVRRDEVRLEGRGTAVDRNDNGTEMMLGG